ncbi:MAG TPA: hypothetical protein VJQ85_13550 [Gaiellaceae bacterium]|nr:hypothetical protein [Gaiellaceae bacterium]
MHTWEAPGRAMGRVRPAADAAPMLRDRSAMPIFMSSRTRARHGAVMYAAAIAMLVTAVVLRVAA